MCYEEFNETNEYLDLSHRNLGFNGILEILDDLANDNMIRQVSLSHNILFEETENPKNVELFLSKLKRILPINRKIIALDFAGNHFFQNHPHPFNEHKKNYTFELADLLSLTNITHIDLSENNITGHTGREFHGLIYFLEKWRKRKGKSFQCRLSSLNSLGLRAITHALGVHSSLTYLDISDNLGGLDPSNRPSSEGIMALSNALKQSMHLKTLKIARNFLSDEDCDYISEALHDMPSFQDLDISGNLLTRFCTRGLKKTLCSHAIPCANGGFRSLDLSTNIIGDEGVKNLAFAVERTHSLKTLHLHFCEITDTGGEALLHSLKRNHTLVEIGIRNNVMIEDELVEAIEAEVETNRLLLLLKLDPFSVDCSLLTVVTRAALQHKLHFLSESELRALHQNESLTVVGSEMCDALYVLSPPPRKALIKDLVSSTVALTRRLEESAKQQRKIKAAMIVYRRVLRWQRKLTQERRLQAILAEAKRKEDESNRRNAIDDDMMSIMSSANASVMSSSNTNNIKRR